jgi:hypothetical protein
VSIKAPTVPITIHCYQFNEQSRLVELPLPALSPVHPDRRIQLRWGKWTFEALLRNIPSSAWIMWARSFMMMRSPCQPMVNSYLDYDIMTCRLLKNAIFSETLGEIMIHIVDIAPYILDKQHQTISAAAKERAFSMFGLDSQSAVHMLPITTLNALKLSTHEPNDVITIAFKLNPSSGQIMSYRVFESIIGPVQTVTLDEADRALHHLQQIKNVDSSGDSRSIHGGGAHLLPGYSKNLLRDLKYVHQFVQQNSDVSKWVGYQAAAATATTDEQPHPHQSGDILSSEDEMTSSASKGMLNKLLSLYSHHAYQFCVANGIHVPIVWSNRMSTSNSIIRRFATKPLRNWISLVRQLHFLVS